MTDALDQLLAQLQSDDRETRQLAAERLGALRDRRAVVPLIGRLRDISDRVQGAAAVALGQIGDVQAVGPLIQALHAETYALIDHEGSPGRYFTILSGAAQALGMIGTPEAIDAVLAKFQADPPLDVLGTAAAAHGLGYVRDPRVLPALVGALRHPTSIVRDYGARALGQLGDPRAVEPLLEALRDRVSNVQVSAAVALGTLRDARAADPLRAIVRSVARFAAGERAFHFHLRAKAARGIALIGDPDSVQLLERGLRSRLAVRRVTAAIGLAYRADPRGLDTLVGALGAPAFALPMEAAEALGALGDRRAIPALRAVAESRRIPTSITGAARQALRQLSPKE